ncbi:hypothetical protein BDZ91DRAFT_748563 [Kalaharituber pfeilii]|nr:hypothetical protein BDZ91DRAFT_748563 [Kalaharituber pfeilii]
MLWVELCGHHAQYAISSLSFLILLSCCSAIESQWFLLKFSPWKSSNVDVSSSILYLL